MKILRNPRFWFLLLWFWIVTLLVLTSIPGGKGPEKFSGSNFRWDYLEHFSFYLLLPVFYFPGRRNLSGERNFKTLIIPLLAGVAFCILTEVIQLWVPGRAFNPVDMALNISGLLIGIPVGRYLEKILFKT